MVTSEVPQLVAKMRLDILLLQEPYAGKLGTGVSVQGLGTEVGVATVLSQYSWEAVASSNPIFELLFLSHLCTAPLFVCGRADSRLLILR